MIRPLLTALRRIQVSAEGELENAHPKDPGANTLKLIAVDAAEALRQSKDISAEMVIQAAEELIRDLRLREKFG